MKKETKEAAPEQPLPQIRSYFTKEINEQIADMDNAEMMQLLKELSDTRFWIAILKYNQARMALSQQSLYSGDPFKDPTSMARNQGILLGLSDLPNGIIQLLTLKEEEAREGNGE